jgi:hypothetical protein
VHRERTGSQFTADEARLLRRLTAPVARGLRTALLLYGAHDVEAALDEPGMLVLADDLSVAAMTPAAQRWLAEVKEYQSQWQGDLPDAIPDDHIDHAVQELFFVRDVFVQAIGTTPSSSASLRVVSASIPTASASATALRRTWSRFNGVRRGAPTL